MTLTPENKAHTDEPYCLRLPEVRGGPEVKTSWRVMLKFATIEARIFLALWPLVALAIWGIFYATTR